MSYVVIKYICSVKILFKKYTEFRFRTPKSKVCPEFWPLHIPCILFKPVSHVPLDSKLSQPKDRERVPRSTAAIGGWPAKRGCGDIRQWCPVVDKLIGREMGAGGPCMSDEPIGRSKLI